MNQSEAMAARVSRRSYLLDPIPHSKLRTLEESIHAYNRQSGLSLKLLAEGGSVFYELKRSYGLFTGVKSIILLKGKTADPHLREKSGIFGELVVLEATKLGLSTCWVGGNYSKRDFPIAINADESPICIITVGTSPKEKTPHERVAYTLANRKSKPLDNLYQADSNPPTWFIDGIKAASLAPSYANAQSVKFHYKAGAVSASVAEENSYRLIDLGIAKAHFALAAVGHFASGNRGIFSKRY